MASSLVKAHIHQPNARKKHHRLHNTKVYVEQSGDDPATVYPTTDRLITIKVPRSILKPGWPGDPEPEPAKKALVDLIPVLPTGKNPFNRRLP